MAGPDQDVDSGMPTGEDSKPGRKVRHWGFSLSGSGDEFDKGPGTRSAAYLAMAPKWDRINALLGGTATMRAAGELYLPRHPYETAEAYGVRLDRAVLNNYTLRTLESLTGKAMKDPPRLVEEGDGKVPDQIVALMGDVDQDGTDWQVFAREWFMSAMAKHAAYVLVDFTRTDAVPGRERTLEDDARDGVRPFWRLYSAEDVIFQTKRLVNGRWRFDHVRLLEREEVPDGEWNTRVALRIRVLEPGRFDLYELKKRQKNAKAKWERIDGGPMGLDEVPLVDFYTAKDGPGEGKPPLEDLAFLNIQHWQSSADQTNILTVARFPMLAVSGASASDGDKPVVIGPNKWLSVADPNGRIYYVEHAGNAIAAGATDLESIEDKMASYGAEFLRRRPGTASATGRVLDSAEAISPLQAMAIDFKDALEQALQLTAKWLRLDNGGSVVYEVKPDISLGDGRDLDFLDAARDRRDISRKTYLAEAKRRDILSEEFDEEKDKEELDKEPPPEQTGLDMRIRAGGSRKPPSGNPGDSRGPKKGPATEKPAVTET